MNPAPRPWAFVARLQPDTSRTPGELALGRRRAAPRRPDRSATRRAGALLPCEGLPAMIAVVDDPVGTVAAALARSLNAIAPLIAASRCSPALRDAWLVRRWAAIAADERGHLRRLAGRWGELCAQRTADRERVPALVPALFGPGEVYVDVRSAAVSDRTA